jgi:NTP pyrophosphatase (non-canonical NTP hydrolase)
VVDLVASTKGSLSMLAELGAEANEIARAKGWDVPVVSDWPGKGGEEAGLYKLGTILSLLHSEVSEALEALRAGDREGFGDELADVVIRAVGLAHGLGFDLDAGVRAKMDENRARPWRHGGKAV